MADNGHKIDIDIELKAQTNKLFSSLDKLSAKFDEITKKDFFKGKTASDIGNIGSEILKLGKDLETLKRELLSFDKTADYSKFTDGAKQKVEGYIAEAKAATKGVQNLNRTVQSAFASAQSDEKRARAQEYYTKKLQAQEESAARRKAQITEDQASRERIASQKSLDRNRQFNEQRVHDETVANTRIEVEREKTRRQDERIAEAARAREFKAQQAELKREQELNKKRVKSAQDTANNIVKLFESAYKTLKQTATGTLTDIKKSYKTLSSEFATIMRTLSLDEYANVFSSQTVKDAITNASSLVESQNILNQVYETDIQSLLDWADTSSYAYGLSENNARTYIANISALLDTLGIKNEELTKEMATSYTKLAGDLASIWNKSTDDAYTALKSGIAGRVLPLRRFGINLTISALDEWVQMKSLTDELGNPVQYKQLSEYNKQLVRYAYIMEKTRDMQGDYGETFNSWANQIKTLKNEWSNFLDLLGKYAIPIMQPVVSWVLRAIKSVEYLIQVLAEFFDLEPYSEDFARFAYMEDIASDVAEDFGDADDNAKKLNNTLKKGVKLLDLYELNFGDDNAAAGTGAGDAGLGGLDLSGQIFDELDKYKDVIPDFDIKIDKKGIREFADALIDAWNWATKLFDTIWNFHFLGLPSLHELVDALVDGFLTDPAGTLTKIISGIFAYNLIKAAAKNIVLPAIGAGLKEALKANPKAFIGAGTMIAGAVVSGLAGLDLGREIVNSIDFESVNTDKISADVSQLLGGALISAVGGFMIAGPVGAALGALAAVIVGALGEEIGGYAQTVENQTDALKTRFEDGKSYLETYKSDIVSMFGKIDYETLFDTYLEDEEQLNSEIEYITGTTIPNLEAKMAAHPDNEDYPKQVEKQYADLKKAIDDSIKSQSNFSTEILVSAFATAGDAATDSSSNIASWVTSVNDAAAALKTIEINRALDLQKRQSLGETLTDSELSELALYTEKYKDILATQNNVLPDITANLKEAHKNGATFNEMMESVKTGEESLTKAAEVARDNLKILFDAGAIDSSEYFIKLDELQQGLHEKLDSISEFKAELTEEYIDQTAADIAPSIIKVMDDGFRQADVKNFIKDSTWLTKEMPEGMKEAFHNADFSEIPGEFIAILRQMIPSEGTAGNSFAELANYFWSEYKKALVRRNLVIDYDNGTIGLNFSNINSIGANEYKDILKRAFGDFANVYIDGKTVVAALSIPKTTVSFKDVDIPDDALNLPSDVKKKISEQAVKDIDKYYSTALKPKLEEGASDAANTSDTSDAQKQVADDFSDGVESQLDTDENIKKVSDGINKNLDGASNESEAEEKGKSLGNAYINGLTSAIQAAHAEGSAYNIALSNLVSDFKTALNNISSSIEDWVNNKLSQGIASLNLPEDITFSTLVNTLKAGRMSIPKLASGAVIPPNNPFLAVLGDQRRGMNVEAPVSVIQEAVAGAVGAQEITVNNTVYLGNTELKDYIVDTVIDSNLVSG